MRIEAPTVTTTALELTHRVPTSAEPVTIVPVDPLVPPDEESTPIEQDTLKEAVQQLREAASGQSNALRFEVDDVTGRMVIEVVSRETDEVIRQIPPKEVIALARRLDVEGPTVISTVA